MLSCAHEGEVKSLTVNTASDVPEAAASASRGTLIRSARLAARLTADDLAVQIGVSETTIRRWESQLNQPTSHNLARIAAFLGIAPAALFANDTRPMSLRSLRELVTLSLVDAAELSGLSPSALSRLESGQTAHLSVRASLGLARTYDCSSQQLTAAHCESVQSRQRRAEARERAR